MEILTGSTEDWFTIEPIDADTFAISEYRHWEKTHCYLLCGTEKAVLIDTGLGVAAIRQQVERLTHLPIQVVTTHAHWDHIGGHSNFEHIAVHKAEQAWLSGQFPLPLAVVKQNLLRKPCAFPAGFSPHAYTIFQGGAQTLLRDGDCLELGGRRLQVIHTPGHSPGHCCFYEPDRKYLYAGDLIYAGCLDAFYPTTNPQLFLQSLRTVQALEVGKILPGHHELHLPVEILDRIERAFTQLEYRGNLQQGSGVFQFEGFAIHI